MSIVVEACESPKRVCITSPRSPIRRPMAEYHPDKIAHLGKELQELAHQKVLEIQRAYQQLKK